MTDVLIWADTLRSPEMRHEVPGVVPDPFLYLGRDGERHVVITPFEVERVEGHDGLQPHAVEEFGWDDLVRQGIPMEEVELGTVIRAVKELGVRKAVVPSTFPLELADRLRAQGVEITPDRDTFVQRRRVKRGVAGRDVYVLASELFHEAGYPTGLHKRDGEILEDGFFHGLGHGVGLEVHEQPWLGRYPGELVEGDVITIEPGLYRNGYGGCRLEDLVLVTKDGAELLTEYPYDLES